MKKKFRGIPLPMKPPKNEINNKSKKEEKKVYTTSYQPIKVPKAKLRFSAYAYNKIIYTLHKCSGTEVSGFGITAPEDPLYVEDFYTIKQKCTSTTTKMDPVAIADFFEDMYEKGKNPVNVGRIWIHTHPTGINGPSGTDEETFRDSFGQCNWAVMAIVTREEKWYCALQYNTTESNPLPPNRIEIPVEVDWHRGIRDWEEEIEKNVEKETYTAANVYSGTYGNGQYGNVHGNRGFNYKGILPEGYSYLNKTKETPAAVEKVEENRRSLKEYLDMYGEIGDLY